jgi:oligo-1,6-glucosidase
VLAGVQTMGRDNARTPMQWDASPQAGFTTGTPWLAVNPNSDRVNVAADRAGERSVFRFYQQLIALRHESAVVALGDFALLAPDHETLYAFTRTWGDETLLVVANASDAALAGPLPLDVSGAHLVLANYPAETDAAAPPAHTLRPWEARLYRL